MNILQYSKYLYSKKISFNQKSVCDVILNLLIQITTSSPLEASEPKQTRTSSHVFIINTLQLFGANQRCFLSVLLLLVPHAEHLVAVVGAVFVEAFVVLQLVEFFGHALSENYLIKKRFQICIDRVWLKNQPVKPQS